MENDKNTKHERIFTETKGSMAGRSVQMRAVDPSCTASLRCRSAEYAPLLGLPIISRFSACSKQPGKSVVALDSEHLDEVFRFRDPM